MLLNRWRRVFAASILSLLLPSLASTTQPPRPGTQWPQAFLDRLRADPTTFTFRRSLLGVTETARRNRGRVARGEIDITAARVIGGVAIEGNRSIPVLMGLFADTSNNPYPVADLQRQLFDGPWDTGTMTDLYHEMSYDTFTVTGTVLPWRRLSKNGSDYEGPSGTPGSSDPCHGVCVQADMLGFLTGLIQLNDASVDFGDYDNDGPDGQPNSGDDDGFVDFAAFVHPETGGECNREPNIWSHRASLTAWPGGTTFQTNDDAHGGGKIRVDDYVVMPAIACDGNTMIQIGVFAHEFGHAFGLPDLYDTDRNNGESAGIGNWGLMAGGSWGGDGRSPETPSHMSAWSKEYLGWLESTIVGEGTHEVANLEDNDEALQIPIPGTNSYYLVSYRDKVGFDRSLPTDGLAIWRIKDDVITAGLRNNSVNADSDNFGVELIEADGNDQLKKSGSSGGNRGDAGDLWPGSSNKTGFSGSTDPSSVARIAICDIAKNNSKMTFSLLARVDACGEATEDDGPGCAGIGALGSLSDTSKGLFALPIIFGLLILLADRRLFGTRAR